LSEARLASVGTVATETLNQLVQAHALVRVGLDASPTLANPFPHDRWTDIANLEVKHYIEDKVRGVAVVNVKRVHTGGVNGTTAALVVRNQTTVRFIEQTDGPPEGTGCGANIWKGYRGYEDPRMFVWRREHRILVNGCYRGGRHMFLYSVGAGAMVRLWVADDQHRPPPPTPQIQKNWTPYIHIHPTNTTNTTTNISGTYTAPEDTRLRFIYSFGLLHASYVLELVDVRTGECTKVLHSPSASATYDKTAPALGSTPLLLWSHPWYVGVAHTRGRVGDFRQLQPLVHATMILREHSFEEEQSKQAMHKRMYRAVPMIFNAHTLELQFGPPITFPRPAHTNAIPWARDGQDAVHRDVQFPYDLQVRGNHVYIGVEFQDRCPTLVRLNVSAFCVLLPKPNG
jgi:hypothetical protein